jgi:hypothetical protein
MMYIYGQHGILNIKGGGTKGGQGNTVYDYIVQYTYVQIKVFKVGRRTVLGDFLYA